MSSIECSISGNDSIVGSDSLKTDSSTGLEARNRRGPPDECSPRSLGRRGRLDRGWRRSERKLYLRDLFGKLRRRGGCCEPSRCPTGKSGSVANADAGKVDVPCLTVVHRDHIAEPTARVRLFVIETLFDERWHHGEPGGLGFGCWLVQSSDADANPHRSPIQAVTMMKMPSANTVVSTMMPMISSPNGNRSRVIATNAYMGVDASLDRTGIAFRQCQVELFRY
jgi:hypothetical protein